MSKFCCADEILVCPYSSTWSLSKLFLVFETRQTRNEFPRKDYKRIENIPGLDEGSNMRLQIQVRGW